MARVLAGGAGAGGVRAAFRSPAVRAQIRAALDAMVDGGGIDRCRLRRTKYKPGRKLTAWFDVAAGSQCRAVAVAWWADATVVPPDAVGLEDEARRRGLAAPFRRLVDDLPGPMRVQVSPFDPAFPRLVAMSDPAHAVALTGLPAPLAVATVRYRPGQRHVLRYGAGRRRVYAKLYADGEGAAAARLTCSAAELVDEAPRAVRWIDAERTVLVPHAGGTPLSRLLAGEDAGAALAGAGRLLRRLHAVPTAAMPPLPPRTVEDEVTTTRRASEAIRALLPAARSAIDEVLEGSLEALETLAAEDPVFLHGDYKADHLLVGARTTVIDFDRCGAGDPALDVAKFLADLRWRVPAARLDDAQRVFLDAYGDLGTRAARARALEPLLSVKLIARRLRLHDAGWEHRAQVLLADAADRLHAMAPV